MVCYGSGKLRATIEYRSSTSILLDHLGRFEMLRFASRPNGQMIYRVTIDYVGGGLRVLISQP